MTFLYEKLIVNEFYTKGELWFKKSSSMMNFLYLRNGHCWCHFFTKRSSFMPFHYKIFIVDYFSVQKGRRWFRVYAKGSSLMTLLLLLGHDFAIRKANRWRFFSMTWTPSLITFLYEWAIIDDFSLRKCHRWWLFFT